MYLNGFGYGWSSGSTNDLALPVAGISWDDLNLRTLPEEVREAIEAHKDEIHSAADMRDLIDGLELRR